VQLNLINFKMSLDHYNEEKKVKPERKNIQKKIDWYYHKNLDDPEILDSLIKERDELL